MCASGGKGGGQQAVAGESVSPYPQCVPSSVYVLGATERVLAVGVKRCLELKFRNFLCLGIIHTTSGSSVDCGALEQSRWR